jgi:hypothetical protein
VGVAAGMEAAAIDLQSLERRTPLAARDRIGGESRAAEHEGASGARAVSSLEGGTPMLNEIAPAMSPPGRTCSTLLGLVQSLSDRSDSAEAVVDAAIELVNSGRVVLTGSLRGCRLSH